MRRLKTLLLNDKFILAVIIVNAIIIFFQGFNFSYNTTYILGHADNFITLIFLFELIAKLKTYGYKTYIKDNWNKFDAILIILAIPSLFFWITNFNALLNLDFLLVLRVTRIFKFFRFLRFFPQINELVNGVKRALKASVIVILGFFVFIFIISVLSTFVFKEISPEHFGNPIKALYSIFKVFTVEGWHDIPEEIAITATPTVAFFIKLYFVFLLLIGGIFGLSLVNSIFVDAMVSDNNDELELKVEKLEKKIDLLIEKLEESSNENKRE